VRDARRPKLTHRRSVPVATEHSVGSVRVMPTRCPAAAVIRQVHRATLTLGRRSAADANQYPPQPAALGHCCHSAALMSVRLSRNGRSPAAAAGSKAFSCRCARSSSDVRAESSATTQAIPLVKQHIVGTAGFEPAASSVSGRIRSPLCQPASSQVAADRGGCREAVSCAVGCSQPSRAENGACRDSRRDVLDRRHAGRALHPCRPPRIGPTR
jgi:hypothetical protein